MVNAKKVWLLGVALGSLFLTPVGVHADETVTRDYDRFDIRFGAGWVFGAETNVTLLGSNGVGTVVDFDKTLDGERSDSLIRVDGSWWMARRHSLNFSWYDVNRSGLKTLARDLEFGDQTFPSGLSVSSELDIELYRLLYRYGLARTDQVDFDIGGGFYVGKVKTAITAQANVGSVTEGTTQSIDMVAPLPTAGVLLTCKLSPRWSTVFSADWFYFEFDEWQGSQTDLQIGLEFHINRHVTLGAAYDRFIMDIEGPVDEGDFGVTNAWNSLYSYLSFRW